MPVYRAHIEATIEDADYAAELSTDIPWLQAQWPAAKDQASTAGKTVTGDPVFVTYTNTAPITYDYEFDVPVA